MSVQLVDAGEGALDPKAGHSSVAAASNQLRALPMSPVVSDKKRGNGVCKLDDGRSISRARLGWHAINFFM
jgi:hypothetical protein